MELFFLGDFNAVRDHSAVDFATESLGVSSWLIFLSI